MDLKEQLSLLKDRHITLVAFGDSITANTHWTGGMQNWVQLLESNLYQIFPKGSTVINSGVSGDSLPGCLNRMQRDVLRFDPDIVIVSFGQNDCINNAPEKFRIMYREMLERLKDSGALVVTRTPTPRVNMEDGTLLTLKNNSVFVDMERYSRVIREVSEELEICCIDHYSMWMRSFSSPYRGEMMLLMGNSIHPNGNGHRRMYHEMAPYFGLPIYHQENFEHLLKCEGCL